MTQSDERIVTPPSNAAMIGHQSVVDGSNNTNINGSINTVRLPEAY